MKICKTNPVAVKMTLEIWNEWKTWYIYTTRLMDVRKSTKLSIISINHLGRAYICS